MRTQESCGAKLFAPQREMRLGARADGRVTAFCQKS